MIEDYSFTNGTKLVLAAGTTAVVVPQSHTANVGLDDFGILIEFALGILAISGFRQVILVAALNLSGCREVFSRAFSTTVSTTTFPKQLVKAAASTWIHTFFRARHNTKDKLHITADRFVRYLRSSNSLDGFVDLCICLESLFEIQTEISFRFSICLSKITDSKNAQEISLLLSDLYDLRSKVVHGSDATKEHNRLQPKIDNIRKTVRRILTTYVVYLAEHSKDDWKVHLRNAAFI